MMALYDYLANMVVRRINSRACKRVVPSREADADASDPGSNCCDVGFEVDAGRAEFLRPVHGTMLTGVVAQTSTFF